MSNERKVNIVKLLKKMRKKDDGSTRTFKNGNKKKAVKNISNRKNFEYDIVFRIPKKKY